MKEILILMILAYVQTMMFSLVSRARNRDNMTYHTFCAIGSNVVWYLTFRVLVVNEMTWALLIPYTIGTVTGSLTGSKVSMWIEKKIGAK